MSEYRPGAHNLITDVPGLSVGNAEDTGARTGVTVVLPERAMAAAADVRGGAPGTREIAALAPGCLVEEVHAIVLSGGSVFGLDAAGAVTAALAARGTGFSFGAQPLPCPVVPAAILFDINNGGDKGWGEEPPYARLGRTALEAAADRFRLGNAGAGFGATAGRLKGGLGSASVIWRGMTVGALVAVNSYGSAVDPRSGDLWVRPFELAGEFGAAPDAKASRDDPADLLAGTKAEAAAPAANTTIAIVASDAALGRDARLRIAVMACDGMARALRPLHTPFDGDTVFAVSTGRDRKADAGPQAVATIGALAADTLARAIGRAMVAAEPLGDHLSWRACV